MAFSYFPFFLFYIHKIINRIREVTHFYYIAVINSNTVVIHISIINCERLTRFAVYMGGGGGGQLL